MTKNGTLNDTAVPESEPAPVARPPRSRSRRILELALVVLMSAAITTLIVVFQDRLRDLSRFGYPGVFLVSMLANATVVFPAPGLAFTFAMGSVLNPWLVGFVAGAGETCGEFVGYLAGQAGRRVVENERSYARLERLTRRYGTLAIFLLAAVPAGLFDVVGLIAGAMRMPWWRFFFAAWAGKTVKTLAFAFAGVYSISWLTNLLG
ncbi:MAG: VTT domain-containing protein [Anaerolineae bacterium]